MPRTILTRALLLGALAIAPLAAGCGGSDPQFADQPTGEFPVEVIDAELKPSQTVAETYFMRVTVKNTGDRTIPALNTEIDLPGMGSTLAFAYADEQIGLAMDQRPVWVVEEGWPKRADQAGRGGTTNANKLTYEFGRLEPGETVEMVWRLVAVRPGNYRLRYTVSAGLGPDTTAVDRQGEVPSGVLPVRITDFARLTRINRKGQVVPLDREVQAHVKAQQESADSELHP